VGASGPERLLEPEDDEDEEVPLLPELAEVLEFDVALLADVPVLDSAPEEPVVEPPTADELLTEPEVAVEADEELELPEHP
jgi:hypothetical protein